MTRREYYTYIVASKTRVIYIGITNNLQRRMREHLTKKREGFTANYNVNRLVWYQAFRDVNDAIAMEKKLKGWTRLKKTTLIEEGNPKWDDLAADWPALADLRWQAKRSRQASPREEPGGGMADLQNVGRPATPDASSNAVCAVDTRSFGVPQDDN